MIERQNQGAWPNGPTRRQVITSVAIALAAIRDGSEAFGGTPSQAVRDAAGAEQSLTRTRLHQEIGCRASRKRIYGLLLDSKQFAAFTGLPAEIDPRAGGGFALFGKRIVGRNVELIPGERIVQAWRPESWNPGVYSIVKFEFHEKDAGTIVLLDHTGFPPGKFAELDSGWHERYWEPLKKFLG
jgi:activator of HSP90 ATPase